MIIGISGKLGSGKDTVANTIKKIDPTFQTKAYAYKLKQIVSILTSCPIEHTMSQEGKNSYVPEFDMTIGQMLQKLGTNVMREGFNENVWINALMIELNKIEGNYIVTDCRFKNEAEAIKKAGGILIRVERPVNPIAANSNRDLTHPSETDLDDYAGFDHIILNDSDLQGLNNKVVSVMKTLNILQ
jgi:hypothetical protein